MKERRSWWKQIVTMLVVTIILVVAIKLIILGYRFDWTGFNGNIKSVKTLWDWLQLLGVLAVPVVVGFGAVWFTTRQGKVAYADNIDNQRETALQTYIDKMSKLLLDKGNSLRNSTEGDEVRTIARVRTLTILPRLDANRKRSVLQFLYESGLISKGNRIVDLNGADLSGANLSGVNLEEADLKEAMLYRAILTNAILELADLRRANMREADLIDAI